MCVGCMGCSERDRRENLNRAVTVVEGVKCVFGGGWRDVTKYFLLKRNKPEYC